MYQQCYDLIQQYIFNGITPTAHTELVSTFLATVGVIALVALPFSIVFKIIKMIIGG